MRFILAQQVDVGAVHNSGIHAIMFNVSCILYDLDCDEKSN